jgi:transposase
MDNVLFNFWLSNFLLPQIGSSHIEIIDNAAFHKSQNTRAIIEEAGCNLIFLPPYSPDLNPIEKFWANLNYATVRRSFAQKDALMMTLLYLFLDAQYFHPLICRHPGRMFHALKINHRKRCYYATITIAD